MQTKQFASKLAFGSFKEASHGRRTVGGTVPVGATGGHASAASQGGLVQRWHRPAGGVVGRAARPADVLGLSPVQLARAGVGRGGLVRGGGGGVVVGVAQPRDAE